MPVAAAFAFKFDRLLAVGFGVCRAFVSRIDSEALGFDAAEALDAVFFWESLSHGMSFIMLKTYNALVDFGAPTHERRTTMRGGMRGRGQAVIKCVYD